MSENKIHEAKGHVPLTDESYKLLVHNIFTPQEISVMISAMGSSIKNLMVHPKKDQLQIQIDVALSAMGKLLGSMPDHFTRSMLKVFEKELGLKFNLKHVQLKEEPKDEQNPARIQN